MNSISINLDGIGLEVDYMYQKGMKGDYLQPDDPDELEILEVIHEGAYISSYLNNHTINRIEELILEKIK